MGFLIVIELGSESIQRHSIETIFPLSILLFVALFAAEGEGGEEGGHLRATSYNIIRPSEMRTSARPDVSHFA